MIQTREPFHIGMTTSDCPIFIHREISSDCEEIIRISIEHGPGISIESGPGIGTDPCLPFLHDPLSLVLIVVGIVEVVLQDSWLTYSFTSCPCLIFGFDDYHSGFLLGYISIDHFGSSDCGLVTRLDNGGSRTLPRVRAHAYCHINLLNYDLNQGFNLSLNFAIFNLNFILKIYIENVKVMLN